MNESNLSKWYAITKPASELTQPPNTLSRIHHLSKALCSALEAKRTVPTTYPGADTKPTSTTQRIESPKEADDVVPPSNESNAMSAGSANTIENRGMINRAA